MDVRTALTQAGFRSVFGAQEAVGGDARSRNVEKGQAMTCDSNNGVTVIYDNDGFPWIAPIMFLERVPDFEGRMGLRKGAYVPFSNDGGYGIRKMFPEACR